MILSHIQARQILAAHQTSEVQLSLDLGLTSSRVTLEAQSVRFPGGERLPWEALVAIAADENGCYTLEGGSAMKVQFFSELTGRAYSLYPTAGAPTMLVSGIPMHRIKETDPHKDTLEKMRAVRPVGNVLDTCTGLGYTAIEACKAPNVTHVTTIELDPVALQVCRANPWSQALFDNPKITQIVGDSFEEVTKLPASAFTRIIHDPPVLSLAGDLYSLEFYEALYRLLSHSGRLFHYVGDPESKSGRNVTASVARRLQQAGFRQVEKAPRAFGLVANK